LRSALLGALEGTSAEGDRAGEEHIERIADRHPLRILVAEDNLVNQRVAARLLERLGYRADIVANGLEALRALEMAPYDVVFLDIRMPEMDGVTAAAEIAARTTFGRPWLIALTADALAEARSRYLEAGFDDYLAKPFHLRDLAQVLLAVRAKVTEPIPS
jgi:CheY-like chemotaxis protein